jgi:hypothetical protein
MCVTTQKALLNYTYIGTWDIEHPEYGYRHVLIYQNTPANLSDQPNCMLLHIPSAKPLTPENIIDTSEDASFLKKIYDAITPKMAYRGGDTVRSIGLNIVFEMGIYDIAILNDCSSAAVQEAMLQVPEEKRVTISEEMLDFYRNTFPDWPLVLCCFNNQVASEGSPIMIHYSPLHKNTLNLPTIDSHGSVPVLDRPIPFHQKLIIGSHHPPARTREWKKLPKLHYKNEMIPTFLPPALQGLDLDEETIPNNDLYVHISDFQNKNDIPLRFGVLPKVAV